jgi:ketosteroid isomerase-like protein
MNEQANTQLIQRAYQSVATRDIQSFLDLLAEDVLWQLPDMPNVPFSGTWQGRQQVAEFFRRMAEVQDIVEFEPQKFIAQGKKVVVLGRFAMRIKATGNDSRSLWAHVWTIEGGRVTKMREYVDSLAVSRAHTFAKAV